MFSFHFVTLVMRQSAEMISAIQYEKLLKFGENWGKEMSSWDRRIITLGVQASSSVYPALYEIQRLAKNIYTILCMFYIVTYLSYVLWLAVRI